MSIKRSFKADYEFGKQQEEIVLDKLNKFFNDNIRLVAGKYSTNDFVGDKNTYELKSRTFVYNKYPTTMIPANKCKAGMILLFNFTDGLYYIEYDEEGFKGYKRELFQRNARYDKVDKPSEVIYIPISDLKRI